MHEKLFATNEHEWARMGTNEQIVLQMADVFFSSVFCPLQ